VTQSRIRPEQTAGAPTEIQITVVDPAAVTVTTTASCSPPLFPPYPAGQRADVLSAWNLVDVTTG
jgi:hypothetical protein